jgi:hypothetical protein
MLSYSSSLCSELSFLVLITSKDIPNLLRVKPLLYNHGINRQQITICDECLRRYQEKRYEFFGFGKPTGVIAVSVKLSGTFDNVCITISTYEQ